MSKSATQPYKGARDFYPEDKRMQQWMFSKWRQVVEKYGYEEYDAPILEPTDLYLMKGSAEIIEEQTYTFKDRGDRSVTIRTEMTPTVSRMVAGRRQELAYPARWYSIPNLWRYERMQRGRLREFWQLNVDVFGIETAYAELEMIQIVDDIFQSFKAKRTSYKILLNSRILVQELLQNVCGLAKPQSTQLIRLIDKKTKLSKEAFIEAVTRITENDKTTEKIVRLLNTKSIDKLPKELQSIPSVASLKTLLTALRSQGVDNVQFDLTLMRGFDYYTDIVFEVFDTDPENNRSMFGGGRYDGLVAQFGVDPVPTVGFGMGDVTFMNFLESHNLLPSLATPTEVTVIVREGTTDQEVQSVAQQLRKEGVKVAVDYTNRKFDKQFKTVLKSGTPHVLFIGPDDAASGKYVLKDLGSGKEQVHSIERIISIIKDHRLKK